jgi:hypothetical protein
LELDFSSNPCDHDPVPITRVCGCHSRSLHRPRTTCIDPHQRKPVRGLAHGEFQRSELVQWGVCLSHPGRRHGADEEISVGKVSASRYNLQ